MFKTLDEFNNVRNFILQKISKIFILQFLNNQNYFVPGLKHIDTEFAKFILLLFGSIGMKIFFFFLKF